MTLLDTLNIYTLRRFEMIDAEQFNRMHAERNEYDSLDPGQKAAVDEMIRVCRETGMRAERIFPDLVAEVYAFPSGIGNGIHWGMNSLNDGCNFKRGIVE